MGKSPSKRPSIDSTGHYPEVEDGELTRDKNKRRAYESRRCHSAA
jgi:hypothetical protein